MPDQVDGITVVAVTSLDEVISYLLENPASAGGKGSRSAGIQGCASVGA